MRPDKVGVVLIIAMLMAFACGCLIVIGLLSLFFSNSQPTTATQPTETRLCRRCGQDIPLLEDLQSHHLVGCPLAPFTRPDPDNPGWTLTTYGDATTQPATILPWAFGPGWSTPDELHYIPRGDPRLAFWPARDTAVLLEPYTTEIWLYDPRGACRIGLVKISTDEDGHVEAQIVTEKELTSKPGMPPGEQGRSRPDSP